MGSSARASATLAAALLLAAAPGARAQMDVPRTAQDEARTSPQDEARAPRVALSGADADRMRNIFLVSAIPQDDVRKQTERFIRTTVNFVRAPGGAGIIGAIIGAAIADAIINNQIQTRLEKAALALPIIMESVKDFDFREEFWRQLGTRLENDTRFDIADETYLSAERGHLDVPETVNNVPVDAVLDLETTYYLSHDLRILIVRLSALLQSRDSSRVYHRAVYAYDTPPVADEGYESAARAWAADEGAAFRAALAEGADQVLAMLYGDMLGRDRYAAAGGAELKVSDLERIRSDRVIGTIVEQNGGRYIVRLPNGNLISTARGARFVPNPETAARSPLEVREARASMAVNLDDLKDLLPPDARR